MSTASQTPGAQPPPTPPTPKPVLAAEGVIIAAMERGAGTPREWAQAEHDTGLLFDPQTAQDIADAAAEQAHAEDQVDLEGCRAELADARRELAAVAGAQRQINAVRRLLEGRPGTYHLPVALLAAAAEYGTTPYDAMPPMTLEWTGNVHIPGDAEHRAIVECRTPYDTRADLVVADGDRYKLAALVDPEPRDIHAPCPTEGCGTVDDYDASDPSLTGWARVEVAGLGDGPRWYCTPMCVANALALAGEQLAADGIPCGCGKPAHSNLAPCQPDEPAEGDVARCARCGCTDNAACAGGCAWVPNAEGIELCSACATPAELAAAGWTVSGE